LSHPSRKSSDPLTSLLVSPMNANELTSSALRTLVCCLVQAETAHTATASPAGLTAPSSAPSFPHSYHEMALCSSLTATLPLCTLLQQANTPPRQTSKCSSSVVAGLFAASVGFTSPLVVPQSRLQQRWAFQSAVYGRPGSLVPPSRKSSDRSHISASLMHESE